MSVSPSLSSEGMHFGGGVSEAEGDDSHEMAKEEHIGGNESEADNADEADDSDEAVHGGHYVGNESDEEVDDVEIEQDTGNEGQQRIGVHSEDDSNQAEDDRGTSPGSGMEVDCEQTTKRSKREPKKKVWDSAFSYDLTPDNFMQVAPRPKSQPQSQRPTGHEPIVGVPWCAEEDRTLLTAIEEHGTRWAQIERAMAAAGWPRTAPMCRNRHLRMQAPMRPGQAGRNLCKLCGQVKRGHTCTALVGFDVPRPKAPQSLTASSQCRAPCRASQLGDGGCTSWSCIEGAPTGAGDDATPPKVVLGPGYPSAQHRKNWSPREDAVLVDEIGKGTPWDLIAAKLGDRRRSLPPSTPPPPRILHLSLSPPAPRVLHRAPPAPPI